MTISLMDVVPAELLERPYNTSDVLLNHLARVMAYSNGVSTYSFW